MMKFAVLADTHIPKRAKTLPPKAWEIVRSCDAIIHAGDVLTREFLLELKRIAPVYAVRGNNDLELEELPETIELIENDVRIAVIHDSGAKSGREKRMRKRFPDADVVVFGHSHIPWNETVDGLLLFNPGSPTDRRMQPVCTIGILDVIRGSVKKAEIVPVS
jgi:putative phosphoesterase